MDPHLLVLGGFAFVRCAALVKLMIRMTTHIQPVLAVVVLLLILPVRLIMILSPDAIKRCGTVLTFSDVPEIFYMFDIEGMCQHCGDIICEQCGHYCGEFCLCE